MNNNEEKTTIKGYEHPNEINNSNNTPQYMAYSNSNYVSQNYSNYSNYSSFDNSNIETHCLKCLNIKCKCNK